jgi:hypothetical protein
MPCCSRVTGRLGEGAAEDPAPAPDPASAAEDPARRGFDADSPPALPPAAEPWQMSGAGEHQRAPGTWETAGVIRGRGYARCRQRTSESGSCRHARVRAV